MKRKSYISKSIIVLLSLIIILLINRDIIINSNLNSKEIIDLTNVDTYDCAYLGENQFQITGVDPYFVILNVNTNVKNIKVKLKNQEPTSTIGIGMYYSNDASGFTEAKSQHKAMENDYILFDFQKETYIHHVRFDFESVEINDIPIIETVTLNDKKPLDYKSSLICFIINIIILLIYDKLIKNMKKNWKVFNMILTSLLLYCLDYAFMIKLLPFYVRIGILVVTTIILCISIYTAKGDINEAE